MTIIHNFLGECPRCSHPSAIEKMSSTSSFCMTIEEDVGNPLLVQCCNCHSLAWHSEIKLIDKDINDSDYWWLEASIEEYKKVLEDNQVNNKQLSKVQRQYLELLIASREKWKRRDILDDRAEGCLRGLAYADIYGGTSSMALLVFESLIENKNIGKDKVDIDDIGRRYLDWYNKHAVDTGVVNDMVFDLVNDGTTFEEASKQVDMNLHSMTASSRPACRSLPISIYLAGMINKNPDMWKDSGSDKIFENFIDKETKLTHRHLHASQISKAVNKICLCLMLDYSLDESIKEGGYYLSTKTKMSLGLTNNPIEVSRRDLKNSGYADDVLISAIWFIRNTNSFDDAVKESLELKGQSNYCSVLVGAIGGTLYGYRDIKGSIGESSIFECYHAQHLTSGL